MHLVKICFREIFGIFTILCRWFEMEQEQIVQILLNITGDLVWKHLLWESIGNHEEYFLFIMFLVFHILLPSLLYTICNQQCQWLRRNLDNFLQWENNTNPIDQCIIIRMNLKELALLTCRIYLCIYSKAITHHQQNGSHQGTQMGLFRFMSKVDINNQIHTWYKVVIVLLTSYHFVYNGLNKRLVILEHIRNILDIGIV